MAKLMKELEGKIFGDFQVIEFAKKDPTNHYYWKIRCRTCGHEKLVRETELEAHKHDVCKKCKARKEKENNRQIRFENISKEKNIVEEKINEANIHIFNESLLNIPIYYTILFPISDLSNPLETDLLQYKNDFELIDKYFSIKNQLSDYEGVDWELGDILDCDPFIFGFAPEPLDNALTIWEEDLWEKLFEKAKVRLIEKNQYFLAIPYLGDEVNTIIKNVFQNTDFMIAILKGYTDGDTTCEHAVDIVSYNRDF